MGITSDFSDNVIIQDLIQDRVRDAQAKIIRTQLTTKFGRLPKWVDERLETATSVQIERWLKKFVSAETFEGVLGKK